MLQPRIQTHVGRTDGTRVAFRSDSGTLMCSACPLVVPSNISVSIVTARKPRAEIPGGSRDYCRSHCALRHYLPRALLLTADGSPSASTGLGVSATPTRRRAGAEHEGEREENPTGLPMRLRI